jgi:tetratricopeptide (TPR) repeat protein
MDKLRQSITGPDAQKELTRIYITMARDIREQLEDADPARKAKLVEAFRVFLDRIAATTEDQATLQWVGQTLMDLAETSLPTATAQATGPAVELLKTAVQTFKRLGQLQGDGAMVVQYQLGRAQRMLGDFKSSLDTLEALLKVKPTMLDAQTEAALAYEQWAATAPPNVATKVYEAALTGARPDANKKNVIWGWGKISQETSRNPKFQDRFFNARYHVALCRYLAGKAESDPDSKQKLIEKSVTDITRVAALYPELGGPEQRAKFDALLRLIQKELRQPEVGLPPVAAGAK